ncbi:RAMA domain-containing protein [Caerostris extrusa]|uniref:RAMA domain-containing protein n=1 Tax=Caerostris extrusa TaxID=172846 RepID=A0AAV4SC91_CAEEX|nr:RAMA domain-containing protein [Caerostris extrusa]
MNTSPIQINDVTKDNGPIILKFGRSPNSDANSISLSENFTTNKKFMNKEITATPVHEPSNIMDENNKLYYHSFVNSNSNERDETQFLLNQDSSLRENPFEKEHNELLTKSSTEKNANNHCRTSLNETLKQTTPKPLNRICSPGANYSSCVTDSHHNEDHHINLTKNILPQNLSAIVNESTIPVTSMPNPTRDQTKNNLNANQIIRKQSIISLIKLIQHDLLKPGENVLSVHTPEMIIFASLDSNGKIISNGEIYNTPLQWYCNIPNIFKYSQKITKSKACYDRIYYQGRTLSHLVKIYYQRLENQNTSQRVEESSIMLSSCSGLEVTQRSTTHQGVTSLDSAAPISETNVLNLGKMKLLLIGDNEVGPISERDQWDDIDKWDN